jgi:Flp pilus assembly protein TadB
MRAARSRCVAVLLSAALLSAALLGVTVASAQPQQPTTYRERMKQIATDQKKAMENWKAKQQKRDEKLEALIARQADCKRQAGAQKLHFSKRRLFIKQCLAG